MIAILDYGLGNIKAFARRLPQARCRASDCCVIAAERR